MKLLRCKYANIYKFEKYFNKNIGKQEYVSIPSEGNLLQEGNQYYILQEDGVSKILVYTLFSNMLVSMFPFNASREPVFQVDLARIKDHWILYSNQDIGTSQGYVVQIGGKFYTPLQSTDTKFANPGLGYFKTLIKYGVDQAYGLQNG